jgi:hypothetical protein
MNYFNWEAINCFGVLIEKVSIYRSLPLPTAGIPLFSGTQNSYFYVLADGGWVATIVRTIRSVILIFLPGLGLAFETKAGIFNLAWAVGKRK